MTLPGRRHARDAKIVQVNTSDRGGGAERVSLELHRRYRAMGLAAELVVGRRLSDEEGVRELGSAGGGVEDVARAAQRRGRPRLARALRAARRPGVALDLLRGREDFRFPLTRTLVTEGGWDVLHLHNLHGAYFDLRALPELSATRPVVWTLHDEWALTGHCAMTLGCERWQTGCGECPHLDTYPRLRRDGTATNLLIKRAIYRASRIHLVAPSQWLLDRAASSIVANAVVSARVIENGYDPAVFARGDRHTARGRAAIEPGANVIVFSVAGGRRNPAKDYPTFRGALDVVNARPGARVVAIVLGGAAQTEHLGRVEIRFPGFVAPSEVAEYLSAADVYVHASRADVASLAILEALACGCPVVATAVGAIPELFPSGEAVRTIAPGDPIAMADAIDAMLASGDRDLLAEAATAATRGWTIARQATAYLELYEGASSGPGAPP